MTFFGALVNAGSGAFTYHQIADRLTYVVGLIVGRRTVTVDVSPTSLLDPYDYDFHEDPYPYYKRLRDEAPLYHNDELGFWALSRHQDVLQGFRNSTTLSNRVGVSLDPVSRGPHAEQDDVVPRHGRPRPSAAAHPGLEGLHPAAHPRAGTVGRRARRCSISTRCSTSLASG